MSKELILREKWPGFLDSFSRRHVGWLVTVDVLDPTLGTERQVQDLPLVGVTAERSGALVLRVGATGSAHLTHTVSAPDGLWLARTPGGASRGLDISSNGVVTLLRFSLPMPAETVDSPFSPW